MATLLQDCEASVKADGTRKHPPQDGRGISYLLYDPSGNTRHLYVQPLKGGTPVQLTHFDTEPSNILDYAWSRNGKKIAITRARFNDTDIVMFSGFR